MFNCDSAFDEFSSAFANKGDLALARALYGTLVNGEEAADCHAALMAGLKPGHLRASPEWALKTVFGARLPSFEAPRPAMAKSPYPAYSERPAPAPKGIESYNAFKNIWSMWPKDPTRIAETESNAKFAWDQSVAKNGLAATVAACTYYVRKSRGLAHPVNLATWLADEVQFFAAEEGKQPTEADEGAFRQAYSRYPRPALDEDEARDLYCARIQPEDRLSFLAAVIEYGADCREAEREKKYIKKWSTFIASEWREREIGDRAFKAVRDALKEAHGDIWYQTWCDGTTVKMLDHLITQHNAHLAERRIAYEAAEPRMANWEKSTYLWEHSPTDTCRFATAAKHGDADLGDWNKHYCSVTPCTCVCRGRKGAPAWCRMGDRCPKLRPLVGDREEPHCQFCAAWEWGQPVDWWPGRHCTCQRPGHAPSCAGNGCTCEADRAAYVAEWRAEQFRTRPPIKCDSCEPAIAPDCGEDPCRCGNRVEDYSSGNCGREGCQGERCLCGTWLKMPPADLVVDAVAIERRSRALLVCDPYAPDPNLPPLVLDDSGPYA